MKSITLVLAICGITLLSSFTSPVSSINSMSVLDEGDFTVNHRIQLCTYTDVVPTRVVELMREIGGVTPIKSNGSSTYITAPYTSEKEAAMDLPMFRQLGFDEALQVVEVEEQFLSVRRYHMMYDDKNIDRNQEVPVIKIWK